MLELKTHCERCQCALPPESPNARICSYECTFCESCATQHLRGTCPNCQGELLPRPRRKLASERNMPVTLDRFNQLLERMQANCIGSAADLIGCDAAEISVLEAKYQLQIPHSYRLYLRTMGHRSGRLFTHDHLAAFYPYVVSMTGDLKRDWAAGVDAPPPNFSLPANALLICGRLGAQFDFIQCNGSDDSPVWHFSTWDWKILEPQPSVFAWLESWCGEAEQAIANGYFKRNPKGTLP